MKQMIIAATLVASVAVAAAAATAALAHRSTQPPAPQQVTKPDFGKSLFDQQLRNGR
ncbi:MAG: hypothetical protein ACKVP7_07830 [Hyphomicrobiaceae bacterium]